MLNLLSNNAMLAKTRAMYGKRLTLDDYNEMLRKKSVSEIAAYLKTTASYGEALSNINENSIHRGQLEIVLRREMFHKYTKLCRYDNTKNNDFFFYYILMMEVEQILRCIMLLNAGSPEDFITELPSFLLDHASFDLLTLATVRSFSDLTDVLEATPYKDIIKQFPPDQKGLIDYTACEIALITYCYNRIFKAIDKGFKSAAKREIVNIIKLNIELANFSAVFRLKIYFKKSNEEIQKFLLPFHYKLTKQKLAALLESETVEDFLKAFYELSYGKFIKDAEYSYIEKYTHRLKHFFNKKLLRFSTNAPAVLYAFVTLNEIEIENITNIIEGIRYGVPANDIQKLLII
ncbi:MAG: H+transporting two-sector ATPase subunit [Oscillospiraceae bacterium]|jgi:V/A-type H+-transporting ATPase subunit C|nr:H+transporting two-sector ATPase subunit [Oscillospiraceae bacterium]